MSITYDPYDRSFTSVSDVRVLDKKPRLLTLKIKADVFKIDKAQRSLLTDKSLELICPNNRSIEVEHFDAMNGTCVVLM